MIDFSEVVDELFDPRCLLGTNSRLSSQNNGCFLRSVTSGAALFVSDATPDRQTARLQSATRSRAFLHIQASWAISEEGRMFFILHCSGVAVCESLFQKEVMSMERIRRE